MAQETTIRTYRVVGTPSTPELEAFLPELLSALEEGGMVTVNLLKQPDFVLNLINPDAPHSYRRRSKGTFVAALGGLAKEPDDILKATYPLLVRALANVVLVYVPGDGVCFTTMERGCYRVQATGEAVAERLLPLARARLVIDNEFRTDLEPELWAGDATTEEIRNAGARLGRLDLLPSPFPIEELLDERDLRHVKRLYGIGGLSYGNLSARKDERRFWMSASGVDKSSLKVVGRDILLVSGYDTVHGRMILSVPPDVEPRRVSVDAIEHWMIYQAHPDVGAIIHVHAWMEGIPATDVNYPCGTEELAVAVAELVDTQPAPGRAVIGLRNHGITATGRSLTEILDRIKPDIIRQVPMT